MKRLSLALSLAVWAVFSVLISSSGAETSTPSTVLSTSPGGATQPDVVLLIDDFNYPNMSNLMGGKTQGKEEEPGGLIPYYTPSGKLTMGWTGHSLKMDYNVSFQGAIAYYWSLFGPSDNSLGQGAFFPTNLEGFDYFSFWVKCDKEYPRFSVEIHEDTNGDHLFTLGQDINAKIAISSFIQSTQSDVVGQAAEVIVDAKDQKFLVQERPQFNPKDETESEADTGTIEEGGPGPAPVRAPSPESSAPTPPASPVEPAGAMPATQNFEEKTETTAADGSQEAVVPLLGTAQTNPPSAQSEQEIKGNFFEKVAEAAETGEPAGGGDSETKKIIAPEKSDSFFWNRPKRRSSKRISFFNTGGSTGPVGVKQTPQSPAAKEIQAPVEVKTGSALKSQAVASEIMGSHAKKEGAVLQAPKQVTALRKQDVRWRKVVIPLSQFKNIKHWSSILEVVFVFDYQLGSDKGIIYIDDVLFGTNYTSPTPQKTLETRMQFLKIASLKKGVSAAGLRAIQQRVRQEENLLLRESVTLARDTKERTPATQILQAAKLKSREKIKHLFDLAGEQDFKNEAVIPEVFALHFKIDPQEPTLETVRVEMSVDDGKTWTIAGSLFNNQADGEYFFPWRLAGMKSQTLLKVRFVASDIWGRTVILQDPIHFQVQ